MRRQNNGGVGVGVLLALVLMATAMSGCKGQSDGWAEAVKTGGSHDETWRAQPIFTVRNLAASKTYYRDRLGFRVDWEENYETFGIFLRDGTVVFACEKCQGHPGAWALIFVPDVDDVYDDFKKRGARIPSAPENKQWGLREMLVTDPDGNTMRFAQNIEH
jgi:catechol 2,3-dioxygenase-like lactoylglutathione lyase family enzyme